MPATLFPRKCLYSVLPISLPSKLLFQDALDALGTNATCTALPQPGTGHGKKRTETKDTWTPFHPHCRSCAEMLAADNTGFAFGQLNRSHNPTKLRSICLDRRMCHLSYQGQSTGLSLGRAALGWHSAQRGGDGLWLKSPEAAVVSPPCNTKNKHECVAWAMQLLHRLWARCYFVPRLYILYCLIQKRAH